MTSPRFIKFIVTAIVLLIVLSFIGWEHFHGGVVSHHILNQKDLPAISNWWGVVVLPIYTWFLLSRIEKRFIQEGSKQLVAKKFIQKTLLLFFLGLSLGLAISISFANDYQLFLDNVLYIFLVVSFIFPIYYAECILGFVLAMTFTFGAILPIVFILVMASIGAIIYKWIRPFIIQSLKKLRQAYR
jgi:hypothetical protein